MCSLLRLGGRLLQSTQQSWSFSTRQMAAAAAGAKVKVTTEKKKELEPLKLDPVPLVNQGVRIPQPDFTPTAQQTNLLTTLIREEMYERTKDRPIPEFYAGSILRVTFRETKARGQRFVVGLCIAKINRGIGSSFIIRNVRDGVPFELRFELHNPLVEAVDVLQLARRRRAKLYYLRNRPDEESTVSAKFQAIARTPGRVPVVRAA